MSHQARRPWPPEKREEVLRLYDEGELYIREIVEVTGVPQATVTQWIYDPDGSKNRTRKRGYGGTCIDCGGPTNGYAGIGKAAVRCADCRILFDATRDPVERAESCRRGPEQRWSDEAIFAAMRSVAAGDGTLSTDRYHDAQQRAGSALPSRVLICHRFDTWHKAVDLAGLRRAAEHRGGPVRRFDRDVCVAALRHAGDALGQLPSYSEYLAYRALEEPELPSAPIIRVRCGSWTQALRLAAATAEARAA